LLLCPPWGRTGVGTAGWGGLDAPAPAEIPLTSVPALALTSVPAEIPTPLRGSMCAIKVIDPH